MLPTSFVILAMLLRLSGGVAYLRATLRGKAHPELLSWFMWAATPMIAFFAELSAGVGAVAYVTFALGLSPLLVFLTALIKKTGTLRLDFFNACCILLAVIGVVLWRTTSNPELAILLAIFADIASAVPTLRKIMKWPESEYWPSYAMSVLAMIITLLMVDEWKFAAYAFPSYVMTINSLIVIMILARRKKTCCKKVIA